MEGFFTVEGIHNVNHKPHPFMIGSKHITFAADRYSGMLGDACIADKNFPTCSQPGCNLCYEEHHSDRVLMLSLLQNLETTQARELLKEVVELECFTAEKIDGITFVETPEKYRISTTSNDSGN